MKMTSSGLLKLFALTLIASACSFVSQKQYAEFTVVNLPSPLMQVGQGWNLLWHEELGLLGIYRTGTDDRRYFLVEFESLTSEELVFATEHDCTVKWYGGFSLLPDGRLGLGLSCFGSLSQLGSQSNFLLAYDFHSKNTEVLVKSSLPNTPPLRSYAWRHDLGLGVQAANNGLAGSLFWITPDGYAPMEIELVQGERTWNMAQPFQGITDIRGIATDPAWSPKEDRFVFFAGIFHETTTGLSKIGANLSLYIMDSQERNPLELKSGFIVPSGTIWSPADDWIAFSSQVNRFSPTAEAERLWIYSIASGRLVEIAEGKNISLAWDPTGEDLAAVFCTTITCQETEIRIYDVSEIVESEQ